ncbi:DUF3237 domain-containing protein [Geodermatophilus nigrescens]|uniref:UPF0311 protein SAMN05444351_2073 n=1 Tax=Geodermatophilus nigrescens TaxID=1070870 RepID=A0A1M5II06_9ACTN|nr:DUF3237 domain-containing protein [Geodermatophilus nigrescens]SHG27679.1 Protein of unknown function [Geodermatophilus nigrescens]
MPRLVPEFDYSADIEIHPVGPGPFGTRMEGTITGGEVSGDRLKGRIISGADWLLVGPDGYGRLDVRFTMQMVDGAHVYFQYPGLLELTPTVLSLMQGADGGTDYGDQYFVTTPRLESGDERYAWVNQAVFVGEGRLQPGKRVEYRVSRVELGD